MRLKPIALAVVAAAVCTLTLQAYTTYGKWSDNQVYFYVNPANADVSDSAATSAIQTALTEWSTKAGTPFRYLYGGRVNDTSTGYDNRNVVLFRNSANPSGSGIIATTYWWTYSGGRIVDADIVFWDGSWTFFTGTSGCSGGAYIEDVAAHELGHALGLNHSGVSDATMSSGYGKCSQHMRTLAADDMAGAQALYGSESGATNSAPRVAIGAPLTGGSFAGGTVVAFSGTATDTQDGDLTSRLAWTSSIDGTIGTGGSFTRTLSSGSHTIRAAVTDSGGLATSAQVSITVIEPESNTAPTVTISSPATGASVPEGTALAFSGVAQDLEDGSLTGLLSWTSSLDGAIGTGGSFSRVLSVGSHTITATVRDSSGLTGFRRVNVTVASETAPASATTPLLQASGYKVKGDQKAKLAWQGLTAASVDVYRNDVKVATPANAGTYVDNINRKGNGFYKYRVCASGSTTCSNTVVVSFN
jgi:hypothetical protein